MNSLIIGKGQVGKALHKIIGGEIENQHFKRVGRFQIIHICFPYSREFISEVLRYRWMYYPKYIVVHSTVPVGTCRKCKSFHSPVIGQHSDLAGSIQFFRKFLAPKDSELRKYFEGYGISVIMVSKTEETEALKLFLTTQFGISIIENKLIYEFCRKNKLSFNTVYYKALEVYNDGYRVLDPKFVRPVIKYRKGKIGGSCVMQNCDLLKLSLTKFLKKQNRRL